MDTSKFRPTEALALYNQGLEFGDKAALEEAFTVYGQALGLLSRERKPLARGLTQHNLGCALSVLGERESGTARLEEAVAAYRAVVQEWTREAAPLDWAMTQNNLGTARLEEAMAAYDAALAVVVAAGADRYIQVCRANKDRVMRLLNKPKLSTHRPSGV